jgi:hypothetical protein
VALSDYDKLRKLLKRAFAGTAQPGVGLPILYDEFGYQSKIPAGKIQLYRHRKTKAAQDAISEAQQAKQYQRAFAIAQCQPTVAGILIFHVTDERDMNAWQSGVYYADKKPKSSLRAIRSAALRAQRGSLVKCGKQKIQTGLKGVVFHDPPDKGPTKLTIDFSCTAICRYEAHIVRVDNGAVAATTSGTAARGKETVTLPNEDVKPGQYQYVFRGLSAGKAGTALTRYSRPFTIHPYTSPDATGADPPTTDNREPSATDPPGRTKTLSSLPWLPALTPTVPPSPSANS